MHETSVEVVWKIESLSEIMFNNQSQTADKDDPPDIGSAIE